MAKEKNKKSRKKKPIVYDNSLPQNIVAVGENVEENKRIYISQSVYKKIHAFTKDKTTNESGGVLVGNVIEEFGKVHIIIRSFIEAKYCEGTPTTLKFTHESWEYIHKTIDEKYPKYNIVGWIHTHPNFGIFLSEYDKFIQNNFFNEENQVAYVVDPIQKIEGFYFWINGNIERCKGFYVFDKVENKINLSTNKENTKDNSHSKVKSSLFHNVMIAILSIAVVALVITVFIMNNKLDELSSQHENLVKAYNQTVRAVDSNLNEIHNDINNLQETTAATTSPSTENNEDVTTPSEENTTIESSTEPTTADSAPAGDMSITDTYEGDTSLV